MQTSAHGTPAAAQGPVTDLLPAVTVDYFARRVQEAPQLAVDLLVAAHALHERAHFAPSSCADRATNAAMLAMRSAICAVVGHDDYAVDLLQRRVYTAREHALLNALRAVVVETMDYPPQRPCGDDSHLPSDMVERAQQALALYGKRVRPAMEVTP